jgi:uncharacterized protein with GYD domain
MELVVIGKFRKKPTKDTPIEADKIMRVMETEGVSFVKMYWTLGRYDTLAIVEAPDEKVAMKAMLRMSDILTTETLVLVPREEATRWMERGRTDPTHPHIFFIIDTAAMFSDPTYLSCDGPIHPDCDHSCAGRP